MDVQTLDREELEKVALMAVCACNYYDLADNIDITTDEELWQIIDNRDAECENCKEQ
jgi:hypothetical protein